MNWKIIFTLSLFGLVMAIATVWWIPSKIEPAFWLIIFVICAYFIAKKSATKHFLHGFMVSMVNAIWITGAHILFFNTYIMNHPEMLSMNAQMPMPNHPRLMMLISGPFFGAGFGLILGLFSLIAGKITKRS